MKPTTKFLSVLIATQIAFSCFALAVETAKGKSTAATKTPVTSTKLKVTAKKSTVKTTKAKAATTTAKAASAVKTTAVEPKEAIETEIETIEQMEAATATTGSAIAPVTTSTTTATPAADTKLVKYNISLDAFYNTAAEAPADDKRSQYMSYDLIPVVVIGPVKTLLWFVYKQDLVDDEKSALQDIVYANSLAKPYNAGDYITLSPGFVVAIPQTKASKEVAQLNYAANFNLTIGLNSKSVGLDGMVLNWQTGYTKMNNDFTTSTAGEPLTSYRLRQRINFWYPLIGKLTFQSRLDINSNFSPVAHKFDRRLRHPCCHWIRQERPI